MTDLFWPGDNRAGDLMSDSAFLAAMVEVENSWLGALVDAGVAPVESRADLTSLVSIGDVEAIAAGAEADGNPVIGLLALLRERADGQAAQWLHRGLTSQDVIDTAMMLVPENGWLFTNSCSFHVSPEDFLRVLGEASRDARRPFRFVQWGAQSPDHPVLLAAAETSYLKCAVLRAV